jgi:hypothetical protein
VDFIRAASEDLAANPDEWENSNLADFLSAWSAWLHDSPGWFENRGEEAPEEPSWKFIGEMLMAARVYE